MAPAANLSGVAAPTAGLRWAVGAGGVIAASTDGGTTWASTGLAHHRRPQGVAFVDANDGWAVGAGGVIVATTDGGATRVAQDSKIRPTSRPSPSRREPWLGRRRRRLIAATTDGGTTWTVADARYGQRPDLGVSFADADSRLGRRRWRRDPATIDAPPAGADRRYAPRLFVPSLQWTDDATPSPSAPPALIATTATAPSGGTDLGYDEELLGAPTATPMARVGVAPAASSSAGERRRPVGDAKDGLAVRPPRRGVRRPGRASWPATAGTILTMAITGGVVDITAPRTIPPPACRPVDKGLAAGLQQTVRLKATVRPAPASPPRTTPSTAAPGRRTRARSMMLAPARTWSSTVCRLGAQVEAKHAAGSTSTSGSRLQLSQTLPRTPGPVAVKFTFKVTDAKPTRAPSVRIAHPEERPDEAGDHDSRATYNVTHSRRRSSSSQAARTRGGQRDGPPPATFQSRSRVHAGRPQGDAAADDGRRPAALSQPRSRPPARSLARPTDRNSQGPPGLPGVERPLRDGVAGVATRQKLASVGRRRRGPSASAVTTSRCSQPRRRPLRRGGHGRARGARLDRPARAGDDAGRWTVYLKSIRFWSQEYSSWMPWTRASSTTARDCTGTTTCRLIRPRTGACACRCPRRLGVPVRLHGHHGLRLLETTRGRGGTRRRRAPSASSTE